MHSFVCQGSVFEIWVLKPGVFEKNHIIRIQRNLKPDLEPGPEKKNRIRIRNPGKTIFRP